MSIVSHHSIEFIISIRSIGSNVSVVDRHPIVSIESTSGARVGVPGSTPPDYRQMYTGTCRHRTTSPRTVLSPGSLRGSRCVPSVGGAPKSTSTVNSPPVPVRDLSDGPGATPGRGDCS